MLLLMVIKVLLVQNKKLLGENLSNLNTNINNYTNNINRSNSLIKINVYASQPTLNGETIVIGYA